VTGPAVVGPGPSRELPADESIVALGPWSALRETGRGTAGCRTVEILQDLKSK
jgi:hypothetical protein